MTGGGSGYGICTIEVNVDGAAEIEIFGDNGLLRTLSGQAATWRRFQCNEPLPRNPVDFRLAGVAGRGTVRLLRDPRSTGGRAVVQINDPQGGRGGYTFHLQWRRTGGGGWSPAPHVPPPVPYPPPPGHGSGPGGLPVANAVRGCQDAVTGRLNRDGYPYVTFERTVPDNGPGRHDWVIGTVTGRRGYETTRFAFSCSVDFNTGRVRSIDVSRR